MHWAGAARLKLPTCPTTVASQGQEQQQQQQQLPQLEAGEAEQACWPTPWPACRFPWGYSFCGCSWLGAAMISPAPGDNASSADCSCAGKSPPKNCMLGRAWAGARAGLGSGPAGMNGSMALDALGRAWLHMEHCRVSSAPYASCLPLPLLHWSPFTRTPHPPHNPIPSPWPPSTPTGQDMLGADHAFSAPEHCSPPTQRHMGSFGELLWGVGC